MKNKKLKCLNCNSVIGSNIQDYIYVDETSGCYVVYCDSCRDTFPTTYEQAENYFANRMKIE